MKPTAELDELSERIRLAAASEPGGGSARVEDNGFLAGEVMPAEPVSGLVASALRAGTLDRLEGLLPKARRKGAVPAAVPRWLRPFFRNQGGLNSVVLNILECLVGSQRQLAEQMNASQAWGESVRQEIASTRELAMALNLRLDAFKGERLADLEQRVRTLEESPKLPARPPAGTTAAPEPVADPDAAADPSELGRLWARLDAQEAYARTVHGHLDKLGEHVDAGLARLDGQVAALREQLVRVEERLQRL